MVYLFKTQVSTIFITGVEVVRISRERGNHIHGTLIGRSLLHFYISRKFTKKVTVSQE